MYPFTEAGKARRRSVSGASVLLEVSGAPFYCHLAGPSMRADASKINSRWCAVLCCLA